MVIVGCCLLFDSQYVLFVVYCGLLVCYTLSVGGRVLAVSWLLFVVLLFVSCLLIAVCYVWLVACYLLFVVCWVTCGAR